MSAPAVSSALFGHLLALGSTILWSSLFIFAKILADRYSSGELTFWRWAIAVPFFLPFVRREVWAARGLIRKHAIRLALISLIGIAGASLLIFQAGKTTTATNMALLMATAPIWIALICRFVLHEPLSGRQAAGLCIAVIGVVVLVTRGDIAHLLSLNLTEGDLWTMGGAMCFGLYSVLLRFRPQEIESNVFLFVIIGMGALWMLPLALHQWLYVKPLFCPTMLEAAGLLHIGVMASLIAFLLWDKAIEMIGAVKAGVVYYSLPFFSYVLALVFLGEQLALPQAVGGLLIIAGIVLSSKQAAGQAPQTPSQTPSQTLSQTEHAPKGE